MTDRVEEIRRCATKIVEEWLAGFTRISDLPSNASCEALTDLIVTALEAEVPVNRDTWSVEPPPGPVPYKVWMPNAAVDQWREVIAARAEVERLRRDATMFEDGWQKCAADLTRVRSALGQAISVVERHVNGYWGAVSEWKAALEGRETT